jgi:uncharacterized membrane protein YhaH (DUF805 family)
VKGNVIGFDADTNTGAISGHDGNRYDFARLDWRGHNQPQYGDIVDFQAIGQRAQDIYLLAPEYVRPSFWQFYFSPRGRISRSQLWLRWILPYFGITLVGRVIEAIAGEGSVAGITISILLGIFSLVIIWPSIAIGVKRFHDRNKSGWYLLFYYIPVILFCIFLAVWLGAAFVAIAAGEDVSTAIGSLGILGIVTILLGVIVTGIAIWFFIELCCIRGTIGANRFGPDPVR